MPRFEWILFDLDGTLWDHRGASDAAIAKLSARHSIPRQELRDAFHEVNERLWREVAAGETDLPTLRVRRFREVLDHLDLAGRHCPDGLGDEYLRDYLAHPGELPGASEALEAAAAHGARLAIVTNGGDDTQDAKLAQLRRNDPVEWMLTSDMARSYKPSPDFFDRAERRLEFSPPERVLIVGDSWRADIEPGRSRGWLAVWISEGAEPPADLPGVASMSSIADFPRWIANPT